MLRAVAGELDLRRVVLDLSVERHDDGYALLGETTAPAAVDDVLARAREVADGPVHDRVVRLPTDDAPEAALVRSAIAPLYGRPDPDAPLLSQYVLGQRLEPLSVRDHWVRVRGEDGHVGWVHGGYLVRCDEAWGTAWERGEEGDPQVALDGELADEAGHTIARLPWGGRILRISVDRYRLPDGREGELARGEVVDTDRLHDRFPARGESVARTARRWLGVPYLWGGVTRAGADCSGFVLSVFWLHGIAVPRDSDLQVTVGEPVQLGDAFEGLRIGDLLFFASDERVDHVGICLGGTAFIHSAMTNGGVAVNDLAGDQDFDRVLRETFVGARRLLPD